MDDVRQECYFRIGACDTSKSPQRSAPNWPLLFNRYAVEDHLCRVICTDFMDVQFDDNSIATTG